MAVALYKNANAAQGAALERPPGPQVARAAGVALLDRIPGTARYSAPCLHTRRAARGPRELISVSLGHTKLESIVRHLGVEVDDALVLAEQTEI